jgi:hypothetical protein
MKYIISENQYKILLKEDRVEFLRNQNVIDQQTLDQAVEGEHEREDERQPGGGRPRRITVEPIENHEGIDIAYIITGRNGKQSIKLTPEIFQDIVDADPSNNKQYIQWMIKVFMNHIKENDINQAVRFLAEDLPEANEFLTVFDGVKNKKVFKRSAPNRPNAPQDVRDINQYNDLAHLYSVVSPFIGVGDDEEDGGGESKLYKSLKKFIDLGEARLAYRDNDVLVYTPLTIDSSCEPLGNLASWCTRRAGNSYFDSYRRNNPKPDGSLSDYYVIMPKKLFDGDDEGGLYPLQFHFESNQLHDKNNSSIDRSNQLDSVLSRFSGLKDFFKKELGALVEMDVRKGTGLMDSPYIKYLNLFGGSAKDHISGDAYEEGVRNIEKLASQQNVPLKQNKYLNWLVENVGDVDVTEYLDKDTIEMVDFTDMKIKNLPDLSDFKKLTHIVATNCGIDKIPPVDYLPADSLTMISISNNNIEEIPGEGYEKLTNLFAISVGNNPIKKVNNETLRKMCTNTDTGFVRLSFDSSGLEDKNKEEFYKTKEEFCTGVMWTV